VVKCGPSTCAGCCEGNRCRGGNYDEACGKGGLACGVCGVDAICGLEKTCEALDPNRYAGDGGGSWSGYGGTQGNLQTCAFFAGRWICW
jgi:hypothetical protein